MGCSSSKATAIVPEDSKDVPAAKVDVSASATANPSKATALKAVESNPAAVSRDSNAVLQLDDGPDKPSSLPPPQRDGAVRPSGTNNEMLTLEGDSQGPGPSHAPAVAKSLQSQTAPKEPPAVPSGAKAWYTLLGQPLVDGIYSGEWQTREASTKQIGDQAAKLLEENLPQCSRSFPALAGLLQPVLKDKITPVYMASLSALLAVVRSAQVCVDKGKLNPSACINDLRPCFEALVLRAGNMNARISAEACTALVSLAEIKFVGAQHVSALLRATEASKRKVPPEALRPRLEVHLKLVTQSKSLACFNHQPADAFNYALLYVSHSDEKVRKAAARLFVEIYRVCRQGPGLEVRAELLRRAAATQMSKPIFAAVQKLDKENGWASLYTPEEESKPASALPPPSVRPRPQGPLPKVHHEGALAAPPPSDDPPQGVASKPLGPGRKGGQAWELDAEEFVVSGGGPSTSAPSRSAASKLGASLPRSGLSTTVVPRGAAGGADDDVDLFATGRQFSTVQREHPLPGMLNDDDERLLEAILAA